MVREYALAVNKIGHSRPPKENSRKAGDLTARELLDDYCTLETDAEDERWRMAAAGRQRADGKLMSVGYGVGRRAKSYLARRRYCCIDST